MWRQPLYISSDHFPIVHEAGAVEGLDALSDTAIGTGFIQRLVSLPEEEAIRADLLKAEPGKGLKHRPTEREQPSPASPSNITPLS